MKIRIIRTEEELDSLKEGWNTLLHSNPEIDLPFYSWEWFKLSWQLFGEPEGKKLYVLIINDETDSEKRILGIFPLVLSEEKKSGIYYRILEFCNTGMTSRNSIFYDSNVKFKEIADAMFVFLTKNNNEWDILRLVNILETSKFYEYLTQDYETIKSLSMIQTKGNLSPYIQLEGFTYDEYFSRYGNKEARRRCKRNKERYAAAGKEWGLQLFAQKNNLQKGIDLSLIVRKNSWKGEFKNENYEKFYRQLTDQLSEDNEVIIPTLMIDQTPIAAQFITCRNGYYYLHTNDYDTAFRETSPGVCLVHLLLIYGFENNWKVFDYTGGDYPYKHDSATGVNKHFTFQLFRSGLKPRLIFSLKTRWLPLLRKLLGKPELEDFVSSRKAQ
ncbi:MAG: GNAT family N-acetyltransferase [Thermoguttaceae bacterium]